MIEILLYFFPAGIALKVKEKYMKKTKTKDYILNYIKYCTFINLLVYTVLFIYSMGIETNIAYSMSQMSFVFKYFVLATVLGIILPIGEEFIRKNIELRIEFHEQTKKKNKKKKRK